ncbi:MAG TPA: ketoacyl-ACP synthase III [Cyclobacteriaceae bacterium]|nr:ketoacyl-ACP synthase III [Cyclobacteriaceae bacterium]
MNKKIYSVITGSGKYLPSQIVENDYFLNSSFFETTGEQKNKPVGDIVATLQKITEIEQRRYAEEEYVTSDMAYFAAKEAIASAKVDPETLDYIIVAHNFGDIKKGTQRIDIVPTLAARAKAKLGIANPYTVAYDLPFGCPGWIQGLIQADCFIRSGDAKKVLVIGAETLSRIADPHDIDSMIYSDGAGAVIVEANSSEKAVGILKHISRSDTLEHADLLNMAPSYNPAYPDDSLFIKMQGRKIYEYALSTVPQTLKEVLDKAGLQITQIKKVLIHQANAKMDYSILSRFFGLYGLSEVPMEIMPMTISHLGNNSVATVPILYDMVVRGELPGHEIQPGDYILFASVGAGMNINAVVYKIP